MMIITIQFSFINAVFSRQYCAPYTMLCFQAIFSSLDNTLFFWKRCIPYKDAFPGNTVFHRQCFVSLTILCFFDKAVFPRKCSISLIIMWSQSNVLFPRQCCVPDTMLCLMVILYFLDDYLFLGTALQLMIHCHVL